MEQLIVRISTLLCIALSFILIATCSANSLRLDVEDDYDLLGLKISHSRKLKVMQEAMAAGKGIESQMKFKETTTGKLHGNKETKMKAKRGERWREWEEEGSDPTDLFTMDYRRVRRRRPIHNKLLPARAGP